MSAATSFTDFHIDFGGSSVFYTVVSGEKIFFLIPPTKVNLQLYEHFIINGGEQAAEKDPGRFADLIPITERFVVRLKEGETLFIPSGWIHAVLTPIDSVIIGGNFLHLFNLERQILVHQLEKVFSFLFFYFFFFEKIKTIIILSYSAPQRYHNSGFRSLKLSCSTLGSRCQSSRQKSSML